MARIFCTISHVTIAPRGGEGEGERKRVEKLLFYRSGISEDESVTRNRHVIKRGGGSKLLKIFKIYAKKYSNLLNFKSYK